MGTLRIELTLDQAANLLEDMDRRQVSDMESHGDTDRFRIRLFEYVRDHTPRFAPETTATSWGNAPRPLWSEGWWFRNQDATHSFRTLGATGIGFVELVRVIHVGRAVYQCDLYPTGRRAGERSPDDTEYMPPVHTLKAAKEAARRAWEAGE